METKQFNIQCSGQFRNKENIFIQQVLPYTKASVILNEDLVLIEYFLNYIIMKQKLTQQIPVSINLLNLNVLANIKLESLDNKFYNFRMTQISFEEVNFDKSFLNNIILRPGILTVLQEFNMISCKQYDDLKSIVDNSSNSKKRQLPDYDDYDLKSRKRAKPFINNIKSYNDDFEEYKRDKISTLKVKTSSFKGPLEVIKDSWNIKTIANPHIDHTFRIIPSINLNAEHKYNNEQRYISCLEIYDSEIKKIDIKIENINRDIYNLLMQYNMYRHTRTSYEINDQINQLRYDEHKLKDRYISFCEARDEVFQLYVGRRSKRRSSISFAAEYITPSELKANVNVRNMFNEYERFYGF